MQARPPPRLFRFHARLDGDADHPPRRADLTAVKETRSCRVTLRISESSQRPIAIAGSAAGATDVPGAVNLATRASIALRFQ